MPNRLDESTIAQLVSVGDGAPSISSKAEYVATLTRGNAEMRSVMDMWLLEEIQRRHIALTEVRANMDEVEGIFKKFQEPPNFPATYVGETVTRQGRKAVVFCGQTKEVVNVDPHLNQDEILPGHEVYLNADRNVIIDVSPFGYPTTGATGIFDRYTEDTTRMIINSHGEEHVLSIAASLKDIDLKSGDLIRWESETKMAYELLERSKGEGFFLEATPSDTFEKIGGLDVQISAIKNMLDIHVAHKEVAEKYGLQRKGSVLLVGPSGTGKTMIARALANYLSTISASGSSRFINVKPGQMNSMWYGQTEQNYREIFRVAREAGDRDPDVPVVIFFDEIDSIAMSRGNDSQGLGDRMLNAFMAEMDGLEGRGNVVVVAATNRRESIDPAMLRPGRLGDMIMEISRPNEEGTKQIFEKYFSKNLPYFIDSDGAARTAGRRKAAARNKIIETVTNAIFSNDVVATLTIGDGRSEPQRRAVMRHDLVNGAVISNIASSVAEMACSREVGGGEAGITCEDAMQVTVSEFATVAKSLSPQSAHNHLPDLPHDKHVLDVRLK